MFSKDESDSKPIFFVSSQDKKISNHTVEWVHSTARNKWKGWYCSAGMQSIYIDFDGNVFVGTCGVGGWYGNVYRQGLAPDKNLLEWKKCTADACPCGADMFTPKVKRAEMIPGDVRELYKRFDDGTHSRSSEVARPDMVLSHVMRKLKMIIWDIGRRCNYSCTYCFPGSHNNYEAHKSLGSLTHAVDGIHDWWLCDYAGKFVITGGEPTLNPNYLELVRYIKNKRPFTPERGVGNQVHTTTNGSRDSKYFCELIEFSDITFSGHTESLQEGRTYARFVENIKACVQQKKYGEMAHYNTLQVRLMLKPGSLPLVKELYREITAIEGFSDEADIACDLVHPVDDKTKLVPYSEEEKIFVQRPAYHSASSGKTL